MTLLSRKFQFNNENRMTKKKEVKLDQKYIIKLIRKSTSNKDLGKNLKGYYKYLKQNS